MFHLVWAFGFPNLVLNWIGHLTAPSLGASTTAQHIISAYFVGNHDAEKGMVFIVPR